MARGGTYAAIWLKGRRFPIVGTSKPDLIEGDESTIEMNGDKETWRELSDAQPTEFGEAEISLDHERNDQEYILDLHKGPSYDILIECPHDHDRQFTGKTTGRPKFNYADAKAAITVMGGPTTKL